MKKYATLFLSWIPFVHHYLFYLLGASALVRIKEVNNKVATIRALFTCLWNAKNATLFIQKVRDLVLLSSRSRRREPAHKNSRRLLAQKNRDGGSLGARGHTPLQILAPPLILVSQIFDPHDITCSPRFSDLPPSHFFQLKSRRLGFTQ